MTYVDLIYKTGLLLSLLGMTCGQLTSQRIPTLISSDRNESKAFFQLDVLPESIQLGESGDDNIWNFVGLQSPKLYVFDKDSGCKAISSTSVSGANLCTTDPWGQERFMAVDGKLVNLLREDVILGEGKLVVSKIYDQPLPIWDGSLAMSRARQVAGQWTVVLTPGDLHLLGIDATHSVQILGNEDLQEIIDAEGLLYLPDFYFDAYRMYRHIRKTIAVVDQTTRAFMNPSDPIVLRLNDLLAQDRIVYTFIEAGTRKLLAEVAMSNNGSIQDVLFRSDENVRLRKYNATGSEAFTLFPSTSDGLVRVNFQSFAPGAYSLRIYNIVGREIWRHDYSINGDTTIREDLTFLPKGTYIYSLIDGQNNKLFTRRFVIINP